MWDQRAGRRISRPVGRQRPLPGNSVDAIAHHLLKQGRGKEFELAQLIDWSISETGDARIIKPLEPDEMWAGGLGNMIMTPENLADAPEGVRLAYNTPEITTNFYKGDQPPPGRTLRQGRDQGRHGAHDRRRGARAG